MKLGVSVYPDLSPLEDIRSYLEQASSCGFTRVFSSMFSMQGANEEIIDYFKKFIEAAHACGMEVSLDVNPIFLQKLGVCCDDLSLFHEIGCDIMRMDISYGKEKDLKMIQNPYGIRIEYNASMGVAEEMDFFVKNHVSKDAVLLGHNFYPQRYTGMKWNKFLAINHELKKYGFAIDAFVSSHAPHTHGVWDAVCGLPTVEKMRDLPIDLQVRELLATGDVDDILIGNAYASIEEMKQIQKVCTHSRNVEDSPIINILKQYGMAPEKLSEKILKVDIDPQASQQERWNLLELFPQADFGDSSEWIWRSRAGRMTGVSIPVRKYENEYFEAGDVVIVNDNYPHYAGEIQIVRIPIQNDGTRNLIGHLAPHEEEMLELIKDGDAVAFYEN